MSPENKPFVRNEMSAPRHEGAPQIGKTENTISVECPNCGQLQSVGASREMKHCGSCQTTYRIPGRLLEKFHLEHSAFRKNGIPFHRLGASTGKEVPQFLLEEPPETNPLYSAKTISNLYESLAQCIRFPQRGNLTESQRTQRIQDIQEEITERTARLEALIQGVSNIPNEHWRIYYHFTHGKGYTQAETECSVPVVLADGECVFITIHREPNIENEVFKIRYSAESHEENPEDSRPRWLRNLGQAQNTILKNIHAAFAHGEPLSTENLSEIAQERNNITELAQNPDFHKYSITVQRAETIPSDKQAYLEKITQDRVRTRVELDRPADVKDVRKIPDTVLQEDTVLAQYMKFRKKHHELHTILKEKVAAVQALERPQPSFEPLYDEDETPVKLDSEATTISVECANCGANLPHAALFVTCFHCTYENDLSTLISEKAELTPSKLSETVVPARVFLEEILSIDSGVEAYTAENFLAELQQNSDSLKSPNWNKNKKLALANMFIELARKHPDWLTRYDRTDGYGDGAVLIIDFPRSEEFVLNSGQKVPLPKQLQGYSLCLQFGEKFPHSPKENSELMQVNADTVPSDTLNSLSSIDALRRALPATFDEDQDIVHWLNNMHVVLNDRKYDDYEPEAGIRVAGPTLYQRITRILREAPVNRQLEDFAVAG